MASSAALELQDSEDIFGCLEEGAVASTSSFLPGSTNISKPSVPKSFHVQDKRYLTSMYPPKCYASVDLSICRGGFPTEQNMPYLNTLGITNVIILTAVEKTILLACGNDQPSFTYTLTALQDLQSQLADPLVYGHTVKDKYSALYTGLHSARRAANHKQINEVLGHVQQFQQQQPSSLVLITCSTGRDLTSVVIGCYRHAMCKWTFSCCVEEMRRFINHKEGQEVHEELVKSFNLG